MEKAYWLSRERASLAMARSASCSESRLVHYDLAGRYSVRAMSAATVNKDFAAALPSFIGAGRTDRAPVESNDD